MHASLWSLISVASVASAVTLSDVCTLAYVESAIPVDNIVLTEDLGLTLSSTALNATAYYNVSVSDSYLYPDATIDYCDIIITYSHNGRDDKVLLNFWLPAPDKFEKRWLSTGGFGYAINEGTTDTGSLPGGIIYGAVTGLTDGGFGGFGVEFDADFPLANGSANWESLYMFSYQAHHEMTLIGKAFTKNFYNMTSDEKVWAYYQACSEGGREGMSQVQRFEDWDGAIIGAPAIRFSFQQVQHLQSNLVQQQLDYYPPPCELTEILNQTIAFCDPLDGLTDGVIARSDLCAQQLDLDSFIGKPYYCEAATATKKKRQEAVAATPAQEGNITATAVEFAKIVLAGLKDSEGKQVYFSYQNGSTWTDAETVYDSTTDTWGLDISGIGEEFVERFLNLKDSSVLENLDNVTENTLKAWMIEGWKRYEDSLQTSWPDLTPYQASGGKVLHYHGESDYSIPTASSIHYYESVREVMYPDLNKKESYAKLQEWYRLFLVPGAGHCQTSTTQPNGPWCQTNFAVIIDWVENGIVPTTLNATHLAGDLIGDNAQICTFPLRPLWTNGTMACVEDEESVKTFFYDLNAFKLPIY